MLKKKTKAAPKSKRSVKKVTNKQWGGDPLYHAVREAVGVPGRGPKKATYRKPTVRSIISEGGKRTKLFKSTSLKGMAKGLGRVGSKVARSYGNPFVMAAEAAWEYGSQVAESHRKSGKRTALQKVRGSKHRAAKAGKPRYGSFDVAIKADRRSQSLKPAKWTRVKVGGDWWNF